MYRTLFPSQDVTVQKEIQLKLCSELDKMNLSWKETLRKQQQRTGASKLSSFNPQTQL